MIKIIIDLLSLLWNKEIDKETFLKSFKSRTGCDLTEDFLNENIEKSIDKKDGEMIDFLIQLGFIIGFSKKSIPVLCKLLMNNIHHKHEDIARILETLKDPLSVESLYEASQEQYDYLDYDDTYQFARKCIKALSAIGNIHAVEKLNLLTKNAIPEISNYAKKELLKF